MTAFNKLKQSDPQVFRLIKQELVRQRDVLEMIPSENYVSQPVMEALGTVLTNKYSEGYPKKRYYQGNAVVDEIELLAQERAQKLFGVPYVNVQALSGSPANAAVYFALLDYKDKIMGLSLAFGGHLTHGANLNMSSKFYTAVNYDLGQDARIDFAALQALALKEKPKIIVCGFTAYPRIVEFDKFAKIADTVGAYLLADVSHVAGLIAAGVHPSPVPYAHIITTTTHKTLRGPRGALIMVTEKGLAKDPGLPKKIDMAIIPGLQGGPHDNQTAAIAIALREASLKPFQRYGEQIVNNAKTLAEALIGYGFDLVGGGTDTHLILIDLRNKGVNGAVAAYALETAGIVVNKNGVPFDANPPFYPSGIRLGTPAITTRGMKERDMKKVATWIARAIAEVQGLPLPEDKETRAKAFKQIRQDLAKNKNLKKISRGIKVFCQHFPLP